MAAITLRLLWVKLGLRCNVCTSVRSRQLLNINSRWLFVFKILLLCTLTHSFTDGVCVMLSQARHVCWDQTSNTWHKHTRTVDGYICVFLLLRHRTPIWPRDQLSWYWNQSKCSHRVLILECCLMIKSLMTKHPWLSNRRIWQHTHTDAFPSLHRTLNWRQWLN